MNNKHGTICPKCGGIILVPGKGLPTFFGHRCKCNKYVPNVIKCYHDWQELDTIIICKKCGEVKKK